MDIKFPIKIVAFDMDETLGYFTQVGVLWDILKELNKSDKSEFKFETDNDFTEFTKMMDVFSGDILRPHLNETFEIVKKAKQKWGEHIKSVLIYTNNNGPLEWVEYITKYLNHKFGTVVDQIVASKENEEFKFAGGIIKEQNLRQTEDKSVDDLLRVCGIDLEHKDDVYICFVDDLEHPQMKRNTVYYICIEQYVNILTPEYIVSKYFAGMNPLSAKQIKRLDFSDETTYSTDKCDAEYIGAAHTTISKELNEQIRWFCMDLVLTKRQRQTTKKNRNGASRKTRRKNSVI